MGSLQEGLIYLVRTLFDLYLFVLIVRFLLAGVRAEYANPLTQLTVRLTNPIVKPVRKIIPNFRDIEISALFLIFVLNLIKFAIVIVMSGGMPNVVGLLIVAFGNMIQLFIQTLTGILFIYVILSWVQPFSPMQRVLYQLISPLLSPFQRLLPPVAGFDLSIIPAFIMLQLITIVVVNPIMQYGMGVAVS